MTIGQKISILRNSVKLSQEQLAEQLDVSRQSVSKWESDASYPEIAKIIQLSSLFNVSIDDLLDTSYTARKLSEMGYSFSKISTVVGGGVVEDLKTRG